VTRFFTTGNRAEADRLVVMYHYSARPPSNVIVCGCANEPGGLFGDSGRVVAACYFSVPPTRWSEKVAELSRLVRRDDEEINLTWLISMTVKFIRSRGLSDLLVSFADNTQGHHGGIYQAASWKYTGMRGACCDGLIVNGHFVPGRSCNSTWGTRSPGKLKEAYPHWDIEPHFDMGKHLYWRAVNKRGAAKAGRLGLKSLAYPKPDGESC
jgi:hypothetical protein